MEENLRRAMLLAHGDPMVFVERPISATLLALALGSVLLIAVPSMRKTREAAFEDE
jgi:putative tricarboxylic transport membrane protein